MLEKASYGLQSLIKPTSPHTLNLCHLLYSELLLFSDQIQATDD